MCPIHRLPPEILAHIFFSILAASPDGDPNDHDLVVMTHVCRDWRAAALDHGALWATVLVTNIDKAKAFIARSRAALLDVIVRRPVQINEGFGPVLAAVTDRLRSLIIESNVATTWQLLPHLVDRTAPHLQTLHVLALRTVRSIAATEASRDIFGMTSEAGTPSCSTTPSLRTLRIDPVWIPWNSNLYRNLSVLELREPSHTMVACSPSQTRLLEILGQCPALQTLTLDLRAIHEPIAPRGDPRWIIALPLLSSFTMHCTRPPYIADLLSHLALPSSTRFEIQTSENLMDGDTYGYVVFPEDCDRLPGLKSFSRVELHSEDSGNITWRLFPPSSADGTYPVVTLSLVHADSLEYAVQEVPASMVESAETFMFRGSTVLNDRVERWSRFFAAAPRLRVLILANPGQDLDYALRELSRPLPHADGTHPALLCPELACLELASLRLDEVGKAEIVRFVSERSRAGLDIKQVKFFDVTGLSTDLLETLRGMGVVVETLA